MLRWVFLFTKHGFQASFSHIKPTAVDSRNQQYPAITGQG
jgi:hypothetical protein